MTDEAKHLVENLRDYIQSYADPYSCGNPSVLFRNVEYDRKSTHDDLVAGWNRRVEGGKP